MTEQASNLQVMIGLEDSGKSTFLAALWQVLITDEVPGSLKRIEFDGESSYMDEIHSSWLAGDPVGRTNPSEEGGAQFLRIKLANEGEFVNELHIPDLSGELFARQWKNREWSMKYDGLVRSATGALFFIHPLFVVKSEMISKTTEDMIAALEGLEMEQHSDDRSDNVQPFVGEAESGELVREVPTPMSQNLIPAGAPLEFDPDQSPTQVKLVDLIQFIAETPYLNKLNRIAIIVSAWDVLNDKYTSAAQYLEKELPLLYQYMNTNQDRFKWKAYGVSAQGGPVVDSNGQRIPEADNLAGLATPSDRIKVVDGSSAPHSDITVPLKWLIEPA